VEVIARPIDDSGNLTNVIASIEWFEPVRYFGQTGQLLGVLVTVTFVLNTVIPGHYRWYVNVPPQATARDNSMWEEANLYVPR